ncbi:MAG: hypothetical protein NZ811_01405, partial [Gammaproteobacteria bacterium]|nr:hypothetical protein [Gammaproteobacteria bacterium]
MLSKLYSILAILVMQFSLSGVVNADCDPFFDDNCEAESTTNQAESYKKTEYYPTGEIEKVQEFVNGEKSKRTLYYLTGEVHSVEEFVNGKFSKIIGYYKTGEVKQIQEYINGKLTKITFYHKTSE